MYRSRRWFAMSCRKCGCSTPRRTCRECELADRAEDMMERGVEWADCPQCGGITSAEGIVCADCRRDDSDENETPEVDA